MPLVTSYSSLQMFAECPRQWYLKDYRRLKPIVEKRTGALGFGGRIHTALEFWGKGADLIEVWHALSSHEYALLDAAGGGQWDTSDLDKETKLGLVMLEGFLEWFATEGDEQEFEVVAVEKQMKNLLHVLTPAGQSVDIWLYGKLDQLLQHKDTGRFRIRDWKTTANLEDATNSKMDQSPQPRIYRVLLAQEFPGLDIDGIRYSMLRKVQRSARATPPFYWNYDIMLNSYNLQAHMTRVEAMAGRVVEATAALDAGEDHEMVTPFHASWRCTPCPVKGICGLWQHTGIQAGEDMIEDQFTVGDPFERYEKEAANEETVVG